MNFVRNLDKSKLVGTKEANRNVIRPDDFRDMREVSNFGGLNMLANQSQD